MARKSRKNVGPVLSQERVPSQRIQEKVYSAALYARLSVETERKREANSIGNQLQLLRDFAGEHSDIRIYDIYTDDDVSGANFLRPDFSRMMNDIRDGKVNCVIVKDLSRLGRNYLESGEYIEMVFPFFGVRFISITDRFDTLYHQADISIQMKNIANEMYAKDISKKICSTMNTLQAQGKYTGSKAPYGYILLPEDKHQLVIDEETAWVVREMFEMIAQGNTLHYVATTLDARGIPSPGRLMYDRGIVKAEKFKNARWYNQTVARILQNPIYLGWMISGKYRSDYYASGEKGSRPVPREEWKIKKGTHDPIVTENLFNQVQTYFERIKQEKGLVSKYDSKSKQASIFKGHLRCGECGQAMYFRHKKNHQKEKTWWYYCALHDNYNSSYCVKKAVKQEDVESVALKLIQTQIKLFLDARALIIELNKKESSKTKYKIYISQIETVRKQIDQCLERKASLYEDYVDHVINPEEYIRLGQEYAKKADELRIFLSELEKESQKYSPSYAVDGNWAKLVEEYQNLESLDEKIVDAFIDQMILFNDGHVEIRFNFRDELDEIIHLSAIRQREVDRYA